MNKLGIVEELLSDVRNELIRIRSDTRARIDALSEETVACTGCEASSASPLAGALRAGWTCLTDDEDGQTWNYLGMCPSCTAAEDSEPEITEQSEAAEYCCTQPALRWEGDPDAPSVICHACGFVVADCGQLVSNGPRDSEQQQPTQNSKQGTLF